MQQRLRQKMKYRTHLIVGSIIIVLTGIFSTFFILNEPEQALAASSGDYRSKKNGNWSSSSSWERYNGSSWVNASSSPDDGDGVITIQNGHTITITSGLTANQLVIDEGAILVNNNANFKISNGSGTDITVNGILKLDAKIAFSSSASMSVNGTVNKNSGEFKMENTSEINVYTGGLFVYSGGSLDISQGKWNFYAGSTYQHDVNGNSIPSATWDARSTCLITGTTYSLPDNLDQTFGNFTINTTGMTSTRKLGSSFKNIAGDLRVISTGSGAVLIHDESNSTVTIGGSYYHDGGKFYITQDGDPNVNIAGNMFVSDGISGLNLSGNGNPTLNISGNLTISGGVLDMSQYSGSYSSKGIGTINLSGDLIITGGQLTETASGSGKGNINFQGTSIQSFQNTGTISNTINAEIKIGSVVDMDDYVFTGSGTFTVVSGSALRIGSPNGITSSGGNGNVQVTGTRSYSSLSSYVYEGTDAQVTGNGLPSTVANISFENASGVTLTNTVSSTGSVTLESGVVTTGSKSLIVGTSTSVTGSISRNSGWVNGNLGRWIPNSPSGTFLFPVGVSVYNEYSAAFTVAPSSPGLMTVSFVEAGPSSSGLPLFETNSYKVTTIGSKGYWNIAASNGLSGGVYSISLLGNGFTGISDLSDVRVVSRTSSILPWSLLGTHAPGTGTIASPVATRTGLGFTQQVTLGWGYNALPIELIVFDAKLDGKTVRLTWSTAAEINNEYFSLERSEDGKNFEEIGQVRGSGNTTTRRDYSFVDDAPLSGESYYRLKQTDYDGKYEIFDPKHVVIKQTILDESKITVWPNPFEDHFDLDIESDQRGVLSVSLLGMDGRTIRSETIIMTATGTRWSFTDGNNLLTGTYILRLQVNDEVLSKKLVRK